MSPQQSDDATGVLLDRIVTTEELATRPSRPPDHAAEASALVRLAKAMTESPETVLRELAGAAIGLCRAESAGISLLETDGDRQLFRWHATAGAFAPYLGGTLPRHFSPCGTVVDRNALQLLSDPARHFPYIHELVPAVTEVLLVPFHSGETAVGTVWIVSHSPGLRFDAEDARLMTSLSQFASAAVRTLQVGRDALCAESQIRETAELHRFAAEAGRTGSWYLRLDTMECVLSPLMAELMGFPRGQTTASAEQWRERVVPADLPGLEAAIAASVERAIPFDFEFRIGLPDGGERWLYSHGGVMRDATGKAFRLHGSTVDLTDRKRTEARLKETEERAAFVRAASGVGFWYCDLPFDVLEWDELVKAHFYLAADAAVTIDTFYARIHPDDREPARRAIGKSIAERTSYDVHYRTVDPATASQRWVRAIGRPFYAPDGTPRRFDGITLDVTAQRRAEEKLRESDRQLRELADSSPAMLWVTDPAGSCTFLSREWYSSTGQTEREALGLGWTSATHPDDRAEAARGFVAANERREEFRLEYRLRGHGGAYRWALDVGRPRFTPEGEYLGMVGVVVDIHDRKRAEDELRVARDGAESLVLERTLELDREQTFLKAVLDNVEDGIVACDPRGVLTLFNRATREFHGLSAESISADAWAERYALYGPDGSTPLVADAVPLARALRGERVRDAEMVIAPTGSPPRTVLASGQPLFDAEGRMLGAVVSMHDVTDRKGREEAHARAVLEEKRAEILRKVARASRSMNSVLSADSIAGIVTAEARSIVGAHISATSLLNPEDPGSALHTFAVSDKHGAYRLNQDNVADSTLHPLVENAHAPVRLTRAELENHPLYHTIGKGVNGWPPPSGWLAVPILGHAGKLLGFIQLSDKEGGEFGEEDEAILVQLSAVAGASIENARLYGRLKYQDRRKDEFLATLAHELRNPLAPVRNGLQILRLAGELPAKVEKVRQMMERQISHLVHLVDDLLDVSRVTTGKIALKMERLELRGIVDAAVETSRPVVEAAGHELRLDLPAGPFAVDADPNRLAQVLTNLITNAAKYTPPGGVIRLRAERRGPAEGIVLSVSDNGVGLPKEMLPKIFDMFTQVGTSLDRAQGGLGIGLTLVRKLVEMHGGTVSAESPGAGQGSTFTIRLPSADIKSEPAPLRSERDTPELPLTSARRILVVDDNIDGAESLAMLLTIQGHDVRTAHSGPAGLDAAREFGPDVLFLDIGLPGMNGYEVAQRLRENPAHRGLVIVALTGWGSEEDRRRSRETGFDDHLTKPVEAERVAEILAKLRTLRA